MVLNDPLWCAYNLPTYIVISNVFQFLPSTVIYRDLGQRPCCASHYCKCLYEKITCQNRWAYSFWATLVGRGLWHCLTVTWFYEWIRNLHWGQVSYQRRKLLRNAHDKLVKSAGVQAYSAAGVLGSRIPSNLDIKTILTAIFESVFEMFT